MTSENDNDVAAHGKASAMQELPNSPKAFIAAALRAYRAEMVEADTLARTDVRASVELAALAGASGGKPRAVVPISPRAAVPAVPGYAEVRELPVHFPAQRCHIWARCSI